MSKPKLIIVMGVSGSGKTTVANAIAEQFFYHFIEADDFHSEQNCQHMASGRPLTNAMREPWIQALYDYLKNAAQHETDCVMAFSGLQAQHRARFKQLGFDRLTLHLATCPSIIQQRIKQRENHFMPNNLLGSQYQDLQDPASEKNTITIDVSHDIDQVIKQTISIIKASR